MSSLVATVWFINQRMILPWLTKSIIFTAASSHVDQELRQWVVNHSEIFGKRKKMENSIIGDNEKSIWVIKFRPFSIHTTVSQDWPTITAALKRLVISVMKTPRANKRFSVTLRAFFARIKAKNFYHRGDIKLSQEDVWAFSLAKSVDW
jgi:hypothetical protein